MRFTGKEWAVISTLGPYTLSAPANACGFCDTTPLDQRYVVVEAQRRGASLKITSCTPCFYKHIAPNDNPASPAAAVDVAA